MTETIGDEHMRAWRGLITAHAALIEQIDQDLGAAGRIPLQWYDVLIELYEAPERRLRMSELARRVVLSRSTLTHLAARLEGEGLVVRERAPQDRRGAYAVLTERGAAALREAWPIYSRGIAGYFARHLSDDEARQLADIFARILAARP